MILPRPHAAVAALAAGTAAALALSGCAGPVLAMAPDPGATPWAIMTPGPVDQGGTGDVGAVLGAEAPALCGAPGGVLQDGSLPAARASSGATISPQGTAQPISLASDIRIASRASGAPFIVFGEEENVVIGAAAPFACTWSGRTDLERIVAWTPDLAPLGVIELRPLDARGTPTVTSVRIAREVIHAEWELLRADGTRAARVEGSFRWDGRMFRAERVADLPAG